MNRDALGPALIALLCILALGVGASSLDSQTSAGSDVGSGGGSGGGSGTGSTFNTGQPHSAVLTDFPTIPKIVLQLLMAALLVGFLVALYLQRDNLRDFAIVVVGLLVAAMILFWALLSLSAPDTAGGGGRFGNLPVQLPGGGGGSPSNEVQTVVNDPPVLVLALIVGVLVVGIAAVFLRPTADDSTPEPESEPTEPETVAELGRAAGRAADRIDDNADPTNEVYRAWREMTEHLAVSNPQSNTPGEFARAAADAGMAHEDVDELTALFETTRYGGSDATEARETRAVDALRRIEDEYGEES